MTELTDTEQNRTEEELVDTEEAGLEQADTEQADAQEEQIDAHKTEMALAQPLPARIYAESDITLQIIVSCASVCDLRGGSVEVLAQDFVLKQAELTTFDEEVNATDEFTLQAPTEPGEYTWTVVYAAGEEDDIPHEVDPIVLSFVVLPHVIGLSSWGVPLPVVTGSTFTINVGARCSAGCKLSGQKVEVYDQQGVQLATGTLGDDTWQTTEAMYWAPLEVQAPEEEGFHKWEIRCPEPTLELAHECPVQTLAFRTSRPSEHVLTVEVIDHRKRHPVKKAVAMLHARGTSYRGYADDTGVAKVDLPKGEYRLAVIAHDYREWQGTVEMSEDVSVLVELVYAPF